MDLGSSRGSNLCAWGDPPVKRGISSGGSGGSSVCHLPPLPRPPSAEDIEAARHHLRLLKAKMPQRSRLQRQLSADPPPRGSSPASRQSRGHSVPPRPTSRDDERGSISGESGGRPSRHDGKLRSQSPKRRLPHETIPDTHMNQEDARRTRADSQQSAEAAHMNQEEARRMRADSQQSLQDQRVNERGHQDRGRPPRTPPSNTAISAPSQPSGLAQPQMPDGLSLPPDAFGEEAPVELVRCEGCGRNFRPEALERHAKICKKVFQDKRKQFNSAANRLGEMENAQQLIKNAKKIEKAVATVKQQESKSGDNGTTTKEESGKPLPRWKKQSLEFRAAMLAAKADTGDETANKKAEQISKELKARGGGDPAKDPTKTQCPHCGRTFNNDAAQRHIDICLKTFGSKPGGGRLVRGGGKSCNPAPKAAPTSTKPPGAVRNDSVSRNSIGNDQSRAYPQQARRAPPPMPGSRR